MVNRINYPCSICKQNINLKTIPDEDIMWNNEDDKIAHTKCLPKDYNIDLWITTDELRDSADLSEL